jgi:hypothetical protein
VRDRVALDLERARTVAGAMVETVRHPSRVAYALTALRSITDAIRFDSHSPLKRRGAFGRARRLAGIDLPFEEVRGIRRRLSGTIIDAVLTVMARAIGRWHREHDMPDVHELMTLVPVNLRRPDEWTEKATPGLAALLSVLGRQFVAWMGEVTVGAVDFIVTNVPGSSPPAISRERRSSRRTRSLLSR